MNIGLPPQILNVSLRFRLFDSSIINGVEGSNNFNIMTIVVHRLIFSIGVYIKKIIGRKRKEIGVGETLDTSTNLLETERISKK